MAYATEMQKIHQLIIHSGYFYSASLSLLLLKGVLDTVACPRSLRVATAGFENVILLTKGIESTPHQ